MMFSGSIEPLARPCLLQQYLQNPNFGISPDSPWLMNVLKKFDIYNGVLFYHKEEWNYVVC
jgi:hypothetical protein